MKFQLGHSSSNHMSSFDEIFQNASEDRAAYAVFAVQRLVLLNHYLAQYANIGVKFYCDMTNDEECQFFMNVLIYMHQEKVMDLSDILPFIDPEIFYK